MLHLCCPARNRRAHHSELTLHRPPAGYAKHPVHRHVQHTEKLTMSRGKRGWRPNPIQRGGHHDLHVENRLDAFQSLLAGVKGPRGVCVSGPVPVPETRRPGLLRSNTAPAPRLPSRWPPTERALRCNRRAPGRPERSRRLGQVWTSQTQIPPYSSASAAGWLRWPDADVRQSPGRNWSARPAFGCRQELPRLVRIRGPVVLW